MRQDAPNTLQAAPDILQAAPDTLQAAPDASAMFADSLFGSAAADSSVEGLAHVPLDELLSRTASYLYTGQIDSAAELIGFALVHEIARVAPKIVIALVLLLFLYLLYRIVLNLLRRVLSRTRYIRPGLEKLALQGFRLAALIGIGITTLQSVGFDPAALVTGIGVAGIALGIAARDTVENIISGVSILADGAIKIGDMVIFNDIYCEVKEITLRTTRLRTPNHETVIVPNRQMANNPVRNHSVGGNLRIDIPFSIAYKEFPQEARRVVLKLPVGDERLSKDSAPEVVVTSLNDSSIDMMLWVYVIDPGRECEITYEYTERIREALRKADIEIPFPHMQVMLEKDGNH
ncbi:MAG: mechanosensitive ion channel family protein [Bacteroidota bacterium]|nr:mechanosensitive ion channel family protein [Bacteroidota bacterium]